MQAGQFVIKYPTYEVILPQTGVRLLIRSMQVSEEEKLKTSLVSRSKFSALISEICWGVIENKEVYDNDLVKFGKSLTLKDREALMFGIYHASYGGQVEIDHTCTSCGDTVHPSLEMAKIFSAEPYLESENILEKRIEKQLDVEGLKVVVRQPTVYDEINVQSSIESSNSIGGDTQLELMIIDKFIAEDEAGNPTEFKKPIELFSLYSRLPVADKKIIHNTYLEEFGRYGIDLTTNVTCGSCGNVDKTSVEIIPSLFRMVF